MGENGAPIFQLTAFPLMSRSWVIVSLLEIFVGTHWQCDHEISTLVPNECVNELERLKMHVD
jgi:hypothetical protein